MKKNRRIFVALPLMDELENIPMMRECLNSQDFKDFEVVCCVNQPENWWLDSRKIGICHRNLQTIAELKKSRDLKISIIDKASQGKGWDKKYFGVGWARKTAMDEVSARANPEDIILSLDGDTEFPVDYFQKIASAFDRFPEIKAISVPYYHKLTGEPEADRAILRYEIYMRCYAINMLRIQNPYAFTALGSAIACTVQAYRDLGGITPHKSGEDFYFLQKLRKFGQVLIDFPVKVFPAARFSDRVFFGTGPAMIKGAGGDWSGYPVYPDSFFDEVEETFSAFPELFENERNTPLDDFLKEKFGNDFLNPLRKNCKSVEKFNTACVHKIDGLRILQYVKTRYQASDQSDDKNLLNFLRRFYPKESLTLKLLNDSFSLENATIDKLDELRNFLVIKEQKWQQTIKILR